MEGEKYIEGYIEKRRFARLALRSKITFSIVDAKGKKISEEKFHGTGKNIGVAGLHFTSNKELKPGTILDLEILLPREKDPVRIKGEVVWSAVFESDGKVDTGVKFVSIDKNHVLLLVKYVCGNLGIDIIQNPGD